MEKKEIFITLGLAVAAATAVAGYVYVRNRIVEAAVSDVLRDALRANENVAKDIYRDMDRAMAEHVEEMARLEAERTSGSARHEELMTVLQAAREAGESLHLDRLAILGELAQGNITSQQAIERLRAMNKPEEAIAA